MASSWFFILQLIQLYDQFTNVLFHLILTFLYTQREKPYQRQETHLQAKACLSLQSPVVTSHLRMT